ncbi:4-hydroxy-tetrahydrodipicolinate synthase [Devriesea agamarum]|uniref:4-hydroxy-tetrahydrodipicolinate synthase n=1 Tax=Devriesea agamarum TaxID=472569 RepID=UPI000A4151AC|nr:4-hydroxy-tetrahydrodipicolinate synthase [Devriesea agamarum]
MNDTTPTPSAAHPISSSPCPDRPFGCVTVAMVTPFTSDGERIDLDAAQRLARHLVDHGCDGLTINGTTGEAPTTSDGEKTSLIRAVREAVGPQVKIMAGVGTNDTRHTLHLADEATKAGADGLLVVNPYYSKPSQDGLRTHLLAVADAAELPVALYDIPGRSAVALSYDTLLTLAEHPRIIAVKDAKGDLLQSSLVMARTDLCFYSGEDALNLPWLAIGASGIVSVVAHLAPAAHAALIAAHDTGDVQRAAMLHRALAPLVEAIMTRMPGLVAVKTVLAAEGSLPHDVVRSPLTGPSPREREVLLTDVRAALETLDALI